MVRDGIYVCLYVSSRGGQTSCALVTGVQTWALPIWHGDSTDQCHVCPVIHGEDRVNDRGQTLPHLVLGIVGLVRFDVVQDDQVGTTVHGVNETQDLRVEARGGERELRLTVEHLLTVSHIAAAGTLGGGTEVREVLA